MRLRLRLVLVLVLAVLAGLGASGSAQAASSRVECGAGYVAASLPWGHKCLRAGEFCKVGNAAYGRYGFTCPSTGHLRRR